MITNKAFFKRNEARIGAEFLLKKALFVIINLSQNPHYICVSGERLPPSCGHSDSRQPLYIINVKDSHR